METLCANSLIKNATNDDADTRMYAIRAMREVIQLIGVGRIPQMKRIVETLFLALNDYSVDRRGDIGSWVREEAMICFKDIVLAEVPASATATLSVSESNIYSSDRREL